MGGGGGGARPPPPPPRLKIKNPRGLTERAILFKFSHRCGISTLQKSRLLCGRRADPSHTLDVYAVYYTCPARLCQTKLYALPQIVCGRNAAFFAICCRAPDTFCQNQEIQ